MCRYRSEFFGLTHMDRDFVAEKVIDGIVNENENIFVPEFLKFVGFILGYVCTYNVNAMRFVLHPLLIIKMPVFLMSCLMI